MSLSRTNPQRFLRYLLVSISLGFMLLATNTSAQNLQFYRFKNTDGITVISTKIPSQFIRKGYDIVTSDGRLIKRVKPEPSAEEKQRILAKQAEVERLQKRDRALLSRYSSVSDIEAERSRKLALLDTDIKLRNNSVDKVNEQITLWQSKAADEERRGQAVSVSTLDKLARLRNQKSTILSIIKQKKLAKQEAQEKFDDDIARFRIIRPQ